MNYTVDVIKMAEADVPGPEVFWMSHWDTWQTLVFQMVLIRGNGRTAIINTGPPSDLMPTNEAWLQFAGPRCQLRRTEAERPLNALARYGVDPDQVDYVLLTPLQAYATANIDLFPNAQICLSRRGWIEDVVAPLPHLHVPRQLCIPDSILQHLLFAAWPRVRLLADEDEVFPGVTSWWAGTHHRSSVVYSIQTASGVVMVGDCAFKFENVEKPHPLGIAESILEGDVAYGRIRQQSNIFLPLYEAEIQSRFPGGRVA